METKKEEIGCKNASADLVPRKNETWSDTNLDQDFNDFRNEFGRLICTCGSINFEILITGGYETSGKCIQCGKYYIVHCG